MVRYIIVFFLLLFSLQLYAQNNDFTDGYVRLILNRKQGSFSLYYLTEKKGRTYQPLFYNNDPSTSYLSVYIDDIVYKPASSGKFRTRIEHQNNQPSLVYESSFAVIKQTFTPVRTANSDKINGVQVTITVENKSKKESFIGLRILIDTSLGEQKGKVPFITNNKLILNEQIVNGKSEELYWISRGNDLSLMGSIINPLDLNARKPDYLHFANWKRLYNSEWELDYREGRSFNYMPYSINDSAVAYHYHPVLVFSGGTYSVSYFLTTDDPAWYEQRPASAVPRPAPPAPAASEPKVEPINNEDEFEPETVSVITIIEENIHIEELIEYQEKLDSFIKGDIELNEDDLFEIERTIQKLKENGQ